MYVHNGDFRTNLLVAMGAVALGVLLSREANKMAVPLLPSSPPAQMPAALIAPSPPPTPFPTATPIPPSPTSLPTEAPAAKTLAAVLFQATVARATQSAIEYRATEVAIGATQADEAEQRNRKAREDELSIFVTVIASIIGVAVIVLIGILAVLLARSREKEAEARANAELRRRLEVEAAVRSKFEQKVGETTTVATSPNQIPRNGNGGQA